MIDSSELSLRLLINHLEDIADGLEEKMSASRPKFTRVEKTISSPLISETRTITFYKELTPLMNLIDTLRKSLETTAPPLDIAE